MSTTINILPRVPFDDTAIPAMVAEAFGHFPRDTVHIIRIDTPWKLTITAFLYRGVLDLTIPAVLSPEVRATEVHARYLPERLTGYLLEVINRQRRSVR